jgi:carbon monoxide dehydrogenase subunit G
MSMELDHSFTVPVPPDRAWEVLLDVERIAPCMPGATVEEFDGEVVTGRIKVKVGPVSLTYRGTAKFIERDPGAQVVVVEASGKETRGAGTASATVRAALESGESEGSTRVTMHTTMNVTGRPAQFGRGVIVEVGGKLVEKFAENLAQLISGGDEADADSSAAAAGATATADAGTIADANATADTDAPADGGAPAGAGAAADASSSSNGTGAAADDGTQPAGDGRVAVTTAAGLGTTESAAAATPAASTATARPAPPAPTAPQSEESITLIRLVGPAILKRVLPAAVAVVAVALLGRRFRHILRRDDRDQKV